MQAVVPGLVGHLEGHPTLDALLGDDVDVARVGEELQRSVDLDVLEFDIDPAAAETRRGRGRHGGASEGGAEHERAANDPCPTVHLDSMVRAARQCEALDLGGSHQGLLASGTVKRPTAIIVGITCLSVAGIAATFMMGDGPVPDARSERSSDAPAKKTVKRPRRKGPSPSRLEMPPKSVFRPKPPPAIGLEDRPRVAVVEAQAQPIELGIVDEDEAREMFQAALDALAEAEADPDSITEDDERVLYKRVTGAFTALSEHLDATTPEGRRELEDANSAMLDSLGELGFEPQLR